MGIPRRPVVLVSSPSWLSDLISRPHEGSSMPVFVQVQTKTRPGWPWLITLQQLGCGVKGADEVQDKDEILGR